MFRVGNLIPGEMTTMTGRRIRRPCRSYVCRTTVRARLTADEIIGEDAYVFIVCLANTYAHHVTIREEYGVQRHEGATTLFGPNTLDGFIDKYSNLTSYLADDATIGAVPPSDPAPPEFDRDFHFPGDSDVISCTHPRRLRQPGNWQEVRGSPG